MEEIFGHIDLLINGSGTWAFVAIAAIAILVANFNIAEEGRIAPKNQFFSQTVSAHALNYAVLRGFGVAAIVTGLFVDQETIWCLLTLLVLTALFAIPLYARGDSLLLNARYPDGGLEPHEH